MHCSRSTSQAFNVEFLPGLRRQSSVRTGRHTESQISTFHTIRQFDFSQITYRNCNRSSYNFLDTDTSTGTIRWLIRKIDMSTSPSSHRFRATLSSHLLRTIWFPIARMSSISIAGRAPFDGEEPAHRIEVLEFLRLSESESITFL